jgi:capsular polysaccharide biosynthesis protein
MRKMFSAEKLLEILLRRVYTIVMVMIVTTGSALGFSLVQEPTYQASVKILVGQETKRNTSLGSDVSGLQELTLTVAEATQTLPVAQAVVERLNSSDHSATEVLQNMSAEPDPGTMFVDVSYRGTDPEETQMIANNIGEVLSQKISGVSLGANAITATVWAPATLPQSPVSPKPALNSVIALGLGFFLGTVLAFLLEYVDNGRGPPKKVGEVSEVPTFGHDKGPES